MPWPKGRRSANWKGGRVIASSGYVLVWKPGHHLADVRGYVYEHRLIAEEKLGRRLMPDEIPHHINGVKTDNRPENIAVLPSQAHHRAEHRRPGSRRRLPDESNQQVACACGCGTEFRKFDAQGRPRRYVAGHNDRIGEHFHGR